MNSEIKQILTNLIVKGEDIPVAHLRYKGDSNTFVTWAIIGEEPLLGANDEALYSVVSLDVDIFSDRNYSSIIDEIKKRFKDNEWLWYEDSSEMYEEDTELYHRTITFKKERSL